MLMSFDEYPEEYKYLEHIENQNCYIFVDNGASLKEKENLKKYDTNFFEIYGYHLIQNYEELNNG